VSLCNLHDLLVCFFVDLKDIISTVFIHSLEVRDGGIGIARSLALHDNFGDLSSLLDDLVNDFGLLFLNLLDLSILFFLVSLFELFKALLDLIENLDSDWVLDILSDGVVDAILRIVNEGIDGGEDLRRGIIVLIVGLDANSGGGGSHHAGNVE
jgi:hypothetical protein